MTSEKNNKSKNDFGIINPELSIKENDSRSQFAQVLLQKQITFFDRVFPSTIDKQAMKYQSQLMNQESKHNNNMHRVMSEFQLKAVTEAANKVLQDGIVKARENSAHTYSDKIKILQDNMEQITLGVSTSIDNALEGLSTIKNEYLRKRREEYLIKQIEQFYDVIEYIMDDFRSITQNLIK